jgi:hypothetical protein
MSADKELIAAIQAGNLAKVKACLGQNPDLLNRPDLKWGSNSGYPLHCAASHNQPEIIAFLVAELKQDVNRKAGVSCEYTPLHHAEEAKAYAAAATLLSLGADPKVPRQGGQTTVNFCNLPEVQALSDPRFHEKQRARRQGEREQKAAGTWTRTGPREVVHDVELIDANCRLTDVFNFDARSWRTLARDLDHGGVTHSMVFFDALPDDEILRPAFDKLKELGGETRDEDLGSRRLLKTAKPGLGDT